MGKARWSVTVPVAFVSAAVGFAAALSTLGQRADVMAASTRSGSTRTIEARRFEAEQFMVVGPDGKRRAELSSLPEGAVLRMYDREGTVLARLIAVDTRTELTLFGATGVERVQVAATPMPMARFFDLAGRTRLEIGVMAGKFPLMRLYDENGVQRFQLGALESTLWMQDAEGEAAVTIEANDGLAIMILRSEDGQVTVPPEPQ